MVKNAISGLALTEANYHAAIALLEACFGSMECIIAKHMEVLLNVESVAWQENTSALRALYDKVEMHLRALKSLGVPAEAYNSLLPSLSLKKLPNELCLSISRKLSEADWKLDNIMDELSKELKARERAVAEGSKAESERSNKGRKLPGTTTTLLSGNQYFCFCGQSHLPDSCRKVTDPEARQKLLKEAGRCFLCLRKGHMSKNWGARCSNCGGHHHKSICFKSERQSDESSSQDFHSQGERSLNSKAELFNFASLFVDHDSTVLLQSARAECFNVENAKRHINLRMAFDSGSQRYYITKHACK